MRRSRALAAGFLALGLLLGGSSPAAADGPFRLVILRLEPSEYPTVQIVASVVDAEGRPVKGVTPADLTVTEEGVEQTATIRLASEVAPVAIALVLDTSGSMAGQGMADAKRAIAAMIERLSSYDRAALITFNHEVRLAQALTGDRATLLAATQAAAAGGNTAIYDAIAAAADALRDLPPPSRSAIVLLTDGFDNASRISREDALARAAGAGHPIYGVGLGSDVDRGVLQALAASTRGGQAFVAPTSDQLSGIYESLSAQLLTQYTIQYRSAAASARDGDALLVGLRLVRDGKTRAEVSATYTVPVGRGAIVAQRTPIPAPVAEPARVETIATSRAPGRAALVGVFGGLGALALLLWAFDVTARGRRERRRLRSFAPQALVGAEALWTGQPVRPLRERVRPFLTVIGHRFATLTPAGLLTATTRRLEQAGGPFGLEAVEFVGLRVGAAAVGAFLVLSFLWLNGALPELVAGGVAIALVLGYVAPDVAIARVIRQRKTEILRVLPSSLDMLALSVEAGLAFDGAIAHVALRRRNALSEEFQRLLVEFQMGRQRRQALREMARRTGASEVVRFTNAVMQADALGAPLAKVLHDLAAEFRTKRRQRAEELARTAPIKMLFPMVLLIFPALFVVILGPAVPRLLAVFGGSYR